MRSTKIEETDLPQQQEKEDIVITTIDKKQNNKEDDLPARVEFTLTQKEKRDLKQHAKERYGLTASALIRMLLKEKNII